MTSPSLSYASLEYFTQIYPLSPEKLAATNFNLCFSVTASSSVTHKYPNLPKSFSAISLFVIVDSALSASFRNFLAVI